MNEVHYGAGSESYPNLNYQQDYYNRFDLHDQPMPGSFYNEFYSCPGGVVIAALAHYFMVAVLAWTACEESSEILNKFLFIFLF